MWQWETVRFRAPCKYLKDENGDKTIEKLVSISEEINLSADKEFNEFYMNEMFF